MSGANYWWMLLMLAVLLASHALRAWRWRYLLEPAKPAIGFRNLFSAVMVGYFLNNVLPRAGEIVRPYSIGKLEAIPKSTAFGTIVVERIMDTFSFLVLVVIIPFIYTGPLRESFPWLAETGVIISCVTGGGMALLVILMLRRDWAAATAGVLTRMLPEKPRRSILGLTQKFLDGFLFLKQPRNYLIIGVLSVLIWFLYVVMMYVAFFAFGLERRLDFSAAVVVQAISSIGVAMPTPGATGSYHAFTSQTLIRLFSIDPTSALSYATVTHAAGFIGVSVIGAYYFIRDHVSMSEAVAKPAEEIS
jgi:uncharacterized protein (TIRG00374 family)